MKKNILLFLFSLSLLTFVGCEEANLDPTISEINYINFSAPSIELRVDKGSSTSATYEIYSSQVSSSERTYSLKVDATATTADAASYTIPSSFTFPANSNVAKITVDVDDINIISSKVLVLQIENTAEVITGGDLTIDIVRVCESDLAGSYTFTDGNGKAATIVAEADGSYTLSGDNAFGSDYAIYFVDQCDVLTITGTVIEDSFGIAASGTGMVQANGDIVFTYTVNGYFVDRTMTLTKN